MGNESNTLTVATPAGAMPAHLWVPDTGSGPGIVLVQEIFGISPYVVRRAEELRDLGYVVLAPEFYWRIGASGVANGPDMLAEGMALAGRIDWPAAVEDGVAALGALRQRPEVAGPVGLLGYCFGGGLAFNIAAESDPACLVSYYGSALPSLLDLSPRVTCPSLHHFGSADSYLDQAAVEAIRDAVVREEVEFYTYPGADHAFDNEDFPTHHAEASAIARQLTHNFLAKHLGP